MKNGKWWLIYEFMNLWMEKFKGLNKIMNVEMNEK